MVAIFYRYHCACAPQRRSRCARIALLGLLIMAPQLASAADQYGAPVTALGDPQAVEPIKTDKGISLTFMLLDIEGFAISQSGQSTYERSLATSNMVEDFLADAAFGFRLRHRF